MSKQYQYSIFIALTLFCSMMFGQGYPPISVFSPKDYQAENQNWAISQSKEKFIYVANNKGLLEFDGARWKLYPTPNETIMRSVKVIGDKIFCGFYMDFGYWVRNDYGDLSYVSIAKKNNIPLLGDEQFWNIVELDGWIIIQSLQRIYLFNITTEAYKIIDAPSKITKMMEVDGSIYFHQKGRGVFKIEKGVAELVSDDPVVKNNDVINIFSRDGNLLFLTNKSGFFLFNGKKLSPWIINGFQFQDETIYSGIQLKDGGFVLGSISSGAIFLTYEGSIDYTIEQENGLSNNTVLSIFEDAENNVWLALDNGINSINTKSNIKIYNNKKGALGTIYASIIFNNNLYLGTNQGLFVKQYNTKEEFSLVEGTQGQVWNLVVIDNQLFCAHDSGAFVIENKKVVEKFDNQGIWDIKSLGKNKLLLGSYIGLHVAEKEEGQWAFRNKIEGFDNSSKYFEMYNDNQIFVNHEYKGIFKIEVDSNYEKVLKVSKDTSVSEGAHSSLLKYQGEILYAYKKGVFKYNSEQQSFVKDSALHTFYTDSTYISGRLIYDENENILWGFSSKNISYLTPGKLSATPITSRIPISMSLREGATGYENISKLKDDKYLLGAYNGYIIINTNSQEKSNAVGPVISINSIQVNTLNSPKKNVLLQSYGDFSNDQNNIEFHFSVPFYDRALDVEYQYKLAGLNIEWSNWSPNPSVIFENLDFGGYELHVRAKVGNTLSSNIASYNFTIDRPWYISNTMIAIYALGFILFVLVLHGVNRKYYKKQSKKLLESQQREFELQELEKEKQVMLLKNQQLKADVESKNRELATSTMSIIKKNEFLNTIKNELKRASDGNIDKVIKIIDKDLNNNDDWKMFEEAFNNADKNFIKKVKSMHPDLTPNDLRLCAYLRLNLSSKEIAPLLNISPRSVEVKRYRLRKKMNLAHNDNLTNYILEI